ncbi:hypothetical protein H112_00489 [Trichophyton rubrum D6]|nr:hypothetical protein H100_00487 [Trichophyton rubrum MR850]EZF46561.1 hypothetical protein H102_00488 [Trichophyton rubrum CBS 100081]EZF57259.1 hypothetical protein H103_00487 [Trichophyton rubrum CBS 288.86]EZF67864.1 hypothetical protein H104_00477 [Trichophyton rubrum CBS 289.86]EZF78567.1 hypothetical protein H105_00475 [Trichophyton soudanense CBS 452.61]EZF89013.1 hypothetical protein H110_00492 [Trichophyton rubrum MR1448]EZG21496.1 hypothetical protein H107_00532 [Trichophyton rub
MTGFPAPKYHGERVEVEYTDNKCAFFNGIQIRSVQTPGQDSCAFYELPECEGPAVIRTGNTPDFPFSIRSFVCHKRR